MIYYSKNECDIKNIIDYLNIHGIYVDNPKEINDLWLEFSEENNIKVTKELLETYDFPFEVEEYELLKEVLL